MNAPAHTPPPLLVWFQQTSRALTRFVEVAERSGDNDTAKELLRVKQFFNDCFYKKATGI